MGAFDGVNAKAGTAVAAAMESAGARIQADMLQMVNGADGQMLAGLLFLIALMTAIIIFAVGGNYRWGRYLLIGPPLFFFLTQPSVTYSDTHWVFANEEFPERYVNELIQGVADFGQGAAGQGTGGQAAGGNGGSPEVSLFFQFWNVFTSEFTQKMISLLNLQEDDSHLDFMSKIERYMQANNFDHIKDTNIRIFLRSALAPKCARYYMKQKTVASSNINVALRAKLQAEIDELRDEKVITIDEVLEKEENQVIYGLLAASVDACIQGCRRIPMH